MKKLKLLKEKEIFIERETAYYCDFCGDKDKEVFTSSYQDNPDERNNEMQICFDCIKQLFLFLKK